MTATAPGPKADPFVPPDRTDPVAAAAADLQLADHCYQLALANGDPHKIKGALRFWRDCMADYDQLLREQHRKQQRNR